MTAAAPTSTRTYLVTSGRAVTGSLIRAKSPEAAARKAFEMKRLSGIMRTPGDGPGPYVTVYELGVSREFRPTIEWALTGVEESY